MTEVTAEADPRWPLLARRAAAADGAFVYAVVTTGVYCRPTCPSRRAKPENVRFFATPAEARGAGFRPCLRCDPDGLSRTEANAEKVAEICRRIETMERAPTLAELAAGVGWSPFHLQRTFKALVGVSPRAYAAARRAERFRAALDGGESVTGAVYAAGYGSPSRVYEGGELGMTPRSYRRGGAAEEIAFAFGRCNLGRVLVAATPRGICAILLGDTEDDLRAELAQRYPKAACVAAPPEFSETVAAVVAMIETPRLGLDLPLDIRGTAFQRRVWEALRAIPTGATVTYSDVADQLGLPARSVRAVAAACAANPLAVAVPCHRVKRRDGNLAGYYWGLWRKRALIDRETGG